MKNFDMSHAWKVILLHNVIKAGRVLLLQLKITSTVLKLE